MNIIRFLVFTTASTVIVGLLAWWQTPCAVPISVHVASIDPSFSVDTTQVQAAIIDGAAIWEDIAGVRLFRLTENSGIPIHVVYDARQKTIEDLAVIHSVLDEGNDEHRAIVKKHRALAAEHDTAVKDATERNRSLQKRSTAYNTRITRANTGELTTDEMDALEAERLAIEQEVAALKTFAKHIQEMEAELNALQRAEQRLVSQINTNANTYNEVAVSQRQEFEDGLYTEQLWAKRIDLYLYEDHAQLTRLIGHELGHALGMEHTDDAYAIMHAVNTSRKPTPTKGDRDLLLAECSFALSVRTWLGI